MKKIIFFALVLLCFTLYSCKKEKQPNACFTYEHFAGPTTFHNCSADADHYEWDMGDGNKSFDFEPISPGHSFWNYSYGTYTVTLTALSASENKKDVYTQTIIIN